MSQVPAHTTDTSVDDLPVVILCGGKGTRLQEETAMVPKPMVTVGGYPILWHLLKYFSAFGAHRFVLCLGYKAEVIKRYALDHRFVGRSFIVDSTDGDVRTLGSSEPTVLAQISCIDTGDDAMTGARIHRIREYVGNSTFLLTYGDGLANVDLKALLTFHREQGKAVTVTAVHPPSRFGLLALEGPTVTRFSEKAHAAHDYINGGYFVCEPRVFDYLSDDDHCVFEREPLERLAADGELAAFRHEDFWQCMDTMRDREVLEEIWADGAPWRIW